jgi:hypothetical protein
MGFNSAFKGLMLSAAFDVELLADIRNNANVSSSENNVT